MNGPGVVLLDKDGTLIEDLPYNVDPRKIRLAPGAADALRLWGAAGWRVAVITNQSGVARGYFPIEALDAVASHLEATLRDLGVGWAGFYACPHLPEGINEYAIDCDCRKPEAGLIRTATRDLGIQPEDTWFIGDTWMDTAAGRTAGCRTILVGAEWRRASTYPTGARPDHAVPDLLEAARITLADQRDDRAAASVGGTAVGTGAEVLR
jgi:histidinol-phosphate phosphatase family protein